MSQIGRTVVREFGNLLRVWRTLTSNWHVIRILGAGAYFVWRDALAKTSFDAPQSLKRSSLNPAKQFKVGRWPLVVLIPFSWPRGSGARPDSVVFQKAGKHLEFFAAVGRVVSVHHNNNGEASGAPVIELARYLRTPIVNVSSDATRITMRMLEGPNLAQVDDARRLLVVRALSRDLRTLPVRSDYEESSRFLEYLLRVLSRAFPLSSELTTLVDFIRQCGSAGNSDWRIGHTDLNLFNIVLDGDFYAVIDFEPNRIGLVPGFYDFLTLVRQCASREFLAGNLDEEFALWFRDDVSQSSIAWVSRHRNEFAMLMCALPSIPELQALQSKDFSFHLESTDQVQERFRRFFLSSFESANGRAKQL